MKSDIGECVYVLVHKAWGKTLVGNKLQSRVWWKNRLTELINSPTVVISAEQNLNPGIYDKNGNLMSNPIPFEQEIGWSDNTNEYWLTWMQKTFKKRYEHQATS